MWTCCAFKFSFDEDILAFYCLATIWATFSKIWANFFHNHLVTLDSFQLIFFEFLVNDCSCKSVFHESKNEMVRS
jgi:hypothetical protein